VPITFLLADALDLDPIPLVIIEIVASNIGGTATLIGDPPNIIIAGATDLSFTDFIVNLAPIAAIAFVVVTGLLYAVYRPRLHTRPEARAHVMALDARRSIEDRDELLRTVPILVATIVVFFLHKPIGLKPATVALAGATAMLVTTRQPLEDALRVSSGRRCSSSSGCSSWSARSRRRARSTRSRTASVT
jgi:Na+/H+ antiporter NhaD/arsenite permease-like protein